MNDVNGPEKSTGRNFDWGPPTSRFAENLKEWLVYLFILVILAAGAWFLLDISGQRPPPPPPRAVETASTAESETVVTRQKSSSVSFFTVQLGAFAEREAAQVTYERLVEAGFEPDLSEPTGQFEIYRISFGPFSDEHEAESLSQKLNSLEFHSFVLESF